MRLVASGGVHLSKREEPMTDHQATHCVPVPEPESMREPADSPLNGRSSGADPAEHSLAKFRRAWQQSAMPLSPKAATSRGSGWSFAVGLGAFATRSRPRTATLR